jgi:hypothetical protein
MRDPFKRLKARRDRLQEDAANLGAKLIGDELERLRKRFHRHRFSFNQGMGTRFVTVEPGSVYLLGASNNISDHLDIGRTYGKPTRFGTVRDLADAIERILAISDEVESEFKCEIGEVT